MYLHTKTLLLAAYVAGFALWTAAPLAAQPGDEPTIPRVKPTASRTLNIEASDFDNRRVRYYAGAMGNFTSLSYSFSADGKFLATLSLGGNQLTIWDLTTGKAEGEFGQIQSVPALALSPDGKKLIATSAERHGRNICTVELWDTEKMKRIANLDEGVNFTPFSAAAFAPDGKTVALAGPASARNGQQGGLMIHFWDVTTGDELRKFDGPAGPANQDRRLWRGVNAESMIFAPDGKTLALVADRKILLYEVATGKERLVLAGLPAAPVNNVNNVNNGGPTSVVASLAFSPDGRLLAAACADGQVRLWDVVSGRELLPAMGHKSEVRAVVFTADGKSLLSVGQDNKLLTWSVAEFRKPWTIDPSKMTTKVLNELWDDLRGEDRKALGLAIRLMAETPTPTVAFLREKLRPVPQVDSALIQQLIADLHSDDFNRRKKAVVELRKFGDLAVPAMQQAQQKAGYDEVLMMVTQSLDMRFPTADQIQAGYAIEVLDRICTEESRKLLSELAKGASESNLTRQAQAAMDRVPKATAAGTESTPKMEALWTDLASEDVRKAFQAIRILASRPKEAVPFLRDQLQPLADVEVSADPARLAKLIADLDSNVFETREAAAKELGKLGRRAEAALKKALGDSPNAEPQRRIEKLLEEISNPGLSQDQLRVDRALEALERIGSEDARQALEKLGKDAKNRALKDALSDAAKRLPK